MHTFFFFFFFNFLKNIFVLLFHSHDHCIYHSVRRYFAETPGVTRSWILNRYNIIPEEGSSHPVFFH